MYKNTTPRLAYFIFYQNLTSRWPKNDLFLNFNKSIPELEIIRCLHQLQPKPRALRSGKWKVRTEQYDHDRYPASCTGPAILMSNRAVKILHDTARSTEEDFPIDDIYISGILREKSSLKIQRPLDRDEQLVKVIRESDLEKNQTIASQIL